MIFEKSKTPEKVGKVIGYVFGYFLFTTILYFILVLLHKLPASWNYFYIMGITILIVIVGTLVKRFVK